MTTTTQRPDPMVWHSLRYNDAPAAIEFLTGVFGFELVVSYLNADDDSIVDHAQLHWPEGGGIMLGSHRESTEWPASTGHAAAYIVTRHAADVYGRVKRAGFTLLQDLKDDPYDEGDAGQSFSTLDPEGNMWSFGSYRGEPVR
jgi:uncharacterized glyoxalase superfamily protein PhnB